MRIAIRMGKLLGLFEEEWWDIHFSGLTVFGFIHLEGNTLGASEEVDVAGRASGMGVNRVNDVDDRSSERLAAGVYWKGFAVGTLASVGARGKMRGRGIKISS